MIHKPEYLLDQGSLDLAFEGILFLGEIGDLSFPVQAKRLKCLDEGEIRRPGGLPASGWVWDFALNGY